MMGNMLHEMASAFATTPNQKVHERNPLGENGVPTGRGRPVLMMCDSVSSAGAINAADGT
jgi:hypothetical protein